MPPPTLSAFISYSHEDSRFALRLAQDLKAAGAFIWLDQLDIRAGHSWDNAIEEALGDAAQMILILSPASAKSKNVRDEISFALNRGKEIIPVLHKDCDVPLRLQRSQRIDFRSDYAVGLALLLQHLQGGAVQVAASRQLSRRSMIAGGATASAALAAGAWFGWPRLEQMLQPLPEKRYVALMAWPGANSSSVLSTVIDSMRVRLARAEAKVKDLLIVAATDLPKDSPAPANPAQTITSLGANLVLAATLQSGASGASLSLQVLDAATQRVLRKTKVSKGPAQLSELPEAASVAAEQLLGLPDGGKPLKDEDELKSVSPQVFQLYSDAEQIAAQPNDTGLTPAIEKYEQALNLNTHFALGFARLAMTYTRQYLLAKDKSILALAKSNSALAIRFNPTSAKALLSQGMIQLYLGESEEALASFQQSLKVDPGGPETLLYEAEVYRSAAKWDQAMTVYREILHVRPNYWLAYDALGWILNNQAKYPEAAEQYAKAANAAPSVALPLANLGAVFLLLNKHDEAVQACKESLSRGKSAAAYMTLGDIHYLDKQYDIALNDYQNASELDAKNHVIWRDIADCYAAKGEKAAVRLNYAKAATLLSANMDLTPNYGPGWAALAFYDAKCGDITGAKTALAKVEGLGTDDQESQFYLVQALEVMKNREAAIKLLLTLLDQGLSPVFVEAAPDLAEMQKDPRYVAKLRKMAV